MNKRQSPDVHTAVIAATIAGAFSATLFATLIIIARPHAYSSRIALLGQQTGKIETMLHRPGDSSAYPARAVCRGSPDVAASAFQQQIRAAAGGTGVTIASAEADPGSADANAGALIPIAVQLEANGPYDGVVSMLGRLARNQPELFLDRVDLKSQTSFVNLKLSGRIYCSTSARL